VDYVEAQQILARDVPAVNLWYLNTIIVHNRRLTNVFPSPSGSYAFLETAQLSTDNLLLLSRSDPRLKQLTRHNLQARR